MSMQQLSAGQANAEVVVNENFESLDHQAVYGKRHAATSGLVWGYYGGRWGGFAIANGTLTLTGSTSNYVVVNRSTGAISVSTATTNWNNVDDYARVYKLTTSSTAVTATEDHRAGPDGAHGGGGGGAATPDAADVAVADAAGHYTGTDVEAVLDEVGDRLGVLEAQRVDLEFTASSTTTDSDPGTGVLRWNNATQASATQLFIDNVDADSTSLATLWAALTSGSVIVIRDLSTADRWQIWSLDSAPTNGTGYYKFTVSLLASEGGNIANAAAISVTVDKSGSASASLSNWTESVNTSTPNATVHAARFIATGSATDMDAVVSVKGDGSLLAQVPDNGTGGGNKRGAKAVDWQMDRSANSKVASGSRSVVAGGVSNVASNTGSVVGGGSGNTASGQYAGVPCGISNTASGTDSAAVGGTSNTASGSDSIVIGGATNTASGTDTTVLGGRENVASGTRSVASGYQASTKSLIGANAHASGQFGNVGDAQRLEMVLRRSGSNSTPVRLSADAGGASSTNQLVLQDTSVMTVYGKVVARDFSNNCKCWEFTAAIKRGTGAANTAMVGACTPVVVAEDAGASGFALTVTADTTNGCLAIEGAGAAATTTRWVAHLEAVELKI